MYNQDTIIALSTPVSYTHLDVYKRQERNIPETPAIVPPINTPKIENKALIFTLEPTILGIKILLSKN